VPDPGRESLGRCRTGKPTAAAHSARFEASRAGLIGLGIPADFIAAAEFAGAGAQPVTGSARR
jgi:hypothetical protein